MHESSKPLSENNPTHRPLASPPAPGVAVDPPPVDIGVFLRSLLFICLVLAFGAERRASRLRTGDVDAVGPWRRRRSRHDWFGWGRELAFEEESRDRIVSSASPELDCLFSLFHVFSKGANHPPSRPFFVPIVVSATMVSITSSAQVRSWRRATLESFRISGIRFSLIVIRDAATTPVVAFFFFLSFGSSRSPFFPSISPQSQATRPAMKASRSGECPSHGRRVNITPERGWPEVAPQLRLGRFLSFFRFSLRVAPLCSPLDGPSFPSLTTYRPRRCPAGRLEDGESTGILRMA